ncbi:hypothetical protein DXG03_000640 [Asterophora parasitica]|uniref:non-specific serine/threonine protein kinase n=1 Tax=Asterophora parasitica TaxID=117018 RepID=A0A9P7GAQ6_9AGAR|nr:hypothetical protein DXG03_000640 [Asterophora parasitica]
MAEEFELDDFHFISHSFAENIMSYVHGGYHPVRISDIMRSPLDTSYRIVHKLGFGGCATVWLAEKTEDPKSYVAVKIKRADGSSPREAKCLRARQRKLDSLVVDILDAFDLQCPNGVHSAIVTDVLAPIRSFRDRSYRSRKKVSYDVAKAVAQIHASGIVHGGMAQRHCLVLCIWTIV